MKRVYSSQSGLQSLRFAALTAGFGVVSLACSSAPEEAFQAHQSAEGAAVEQQQNLSSERDIGLNAEAIARWLSHSAADKQASSFQLRADKSWGFENLELVSDATSSEEVPVLRVYYPAGSASPSVSRGGGVALGGAQFYADVEADLADQAQQERLHLSYRVRFSENFDFVKGGKLPGLFGGEGASGGNIPDGTDGFSARLMWRRDGQGEVYAYLPTSETYGTSIGQGSWRFRPGEWTRVEQEVTLNRPGEADGRIRLWINGDLAVDEAGLTFRTDDALRLDGLFFSTFFGGGDASWATPQDVYADFADFTIGHVSER
ncbi:MAG: polysaccharide lyase [Elainellaceae cyanobacterium]